MSDDSLQGLLLDEEDLPQVLSPALLEAYRQWAVRDGSLTVNQNLVYVLARHTLHEHRLTTLPRATTDALTGAGVALGGGALLFALVSVVFFVLPLVFGGNWRAGLVISICLLLMFPFVFWKSTQNKTFDILREKDKIHLLTFSGFFRPSVLGSIVGFILLLLAAQTVLFTWTGDTIGLKHRLSPKDALLASIDTLGRGSLMDVLESYEIEVARPVAGGFFSSTLVFVFRSLYAGLAALIVFVIVRMIAQRRFLRHFRGDAPGPGEPSHFTTDLAAFERGPESALLLKATFFFKIVASYIRLRPELMGALFSFRDARIGDDIRRLLVDEQGLRVLPTEHGSQYEREDWQPPPDEFRITPAVARELKRLARQQGLELAVGAARKSFQETSRWSRMPFGGFLNKRLVDPDQVVCVVSALQQGGVLIAVFSAVKGEHLAADKPGVSSGLAVLVTEDSRAELAGHTVERVVAPASIGLTLTAQGADQGQVLVAAALIEGGATEHEPRA